jgi:hypothetical protein
MDQYIVDQYYVANVGNVAKLLSALTELRDGARRGGFNMKNYYTMRINPNLHVRSLNDVLVCNSWKEDFGECNTASCLAGWCQVVGATTEEERKMDVYQFGMRWLGLDENAADYVFLGCWCRPMAVPLAQIPLSAAIAYLTKVVASGNARETVKVAYRKEQ